MSCISASCGDDRALHLEVLLVACELDHALRVLRDEERGDHGALDLPVVGCAIHLCKAVVGSLAFKDRIRLNRLPLQIGPHLALHHVMEDALRFGRLALRQHEDGVLFDVARLIARQDAAEQRDGLRRVTVQKRVQARILRSASDPRGWPSPPGEYEPTYGPAGTGGMGGTAR